MATSCSLDIPSMQDVLARGTVTHAYATTLNSTRLKMYLSGDAVSSTARVVDCFVCSAGKARFLKMWQRLGEGAECVSFMRYQHLWAV